MGIHEEIVRALRWAGVGLGCQNVCVDACVACDRARDGRIERDGCCVTDAPLSLSHTHTHTSKLVDRSLMYTQCIGICLCLTHA